MRFAETFLNWTVIEKYAPDVFAAIWVTVWIGVAVIVCGLALGAALACLRAFRLKLVNPFIVVFADFFRAIPPLVLILILFFGLPSVGVVWSAEFVLFLVLALVLAAFAEEIFWAGLTSVSRGQWDAGRATGLSFVQVLLHVAFPQAWRMGIPPLVNRALAITKMTALGTVIGVKEILSVASTAQSFSGSATPLTLAAIAYLVVFVPAVILSRHVERRFSYRS